MTPRHALRRIAALPVLMLLAAGAPAMAQTAPAPSAATAEAKDRFDRGIDLFNQGDNLGAIAEFKRAWELVPNPVVLYNLGLVYAAAGRPADAVDALDRLLAAPGKISPERLERARTVREQQFERIGEIQLDLAQPGVLIEVDNRQAGTTPIVGPIRVASGSHVFSATAPGYMPFRVEVTIAGRQQLPLRVTLTPMEQRVAHLTVKTKLLDAEVVVDGQLVGKTPLLASLALPPGPHKVQVRRSGYATAATDITLGEGSSGEVTLDPADDPSGLAQHGGTLMLAISEPQPVVFIDGGLRPGAPSGIRLVSGAHVLRVERGGFLPEERTVFVEQGATTTARVRLEPTPDTLASYVSTARFHRTWGWIGVIGGGAVAAGSGGFLVWNAGKVHDARSAYNEAVASSERYSAGRCDPSTALTEAQIKQCYAEQETTYQKLDDAKARNTYGYVGVGVGSALAVTGLVLLLTGDDPGRYDRNAASEFVGRGWVAPVPWSSPEGAGVNLVGAF